MPNLSFVLPHWLYWSGLVLFPLIAIFLYRRAKPQSDSKLTLPIAYFFLITGGFIGLHRLYLKSKWSLVFISLFVAILYVNVELRESRNNLSGANNEISIAEYKVERAEKNLAKGKTNAEQKLQAAQERLTNAEADLTVATQTQTRWHQISQSLGGAILILLLIDFLLMPRLLRRRNAAATDMVETAFHCPVVEQEHDDLTEPFVFNRLVSRMNGLAGEFVAYWSLIAVIVYYYEVIARYVFNSPTNWAHEGMFLMFGMQYLLAGGYVLRESAHVRVDVFYMHFSNRTKAIVDLITSVFFFIFMCTLMVTGWTFFMDSFEVKEVSFTEWAIQYWPIKFALPLGALLLLLQGIAMLIKDISVAINPAIVELDTEVRPEG